MPLRRTTAEDYERRILRVQQLLEARLDEPIAPIELAKAASFSLHHFHRVFRAQLGESVMQHVRRLRLERAARRIRATSEQIITLAFEAGYDSHEAFTRAFADRFGVTPSHFRSEPSVRVKEWQSGIREHPEAVVTVRAYPAIRVAFTRHLGGYASLDAFWQRMVTWAADRGLLAQDSPLYGVCHDDPDVTAEERLRFDACVVVGDDFRPEGAIGIAEIPAGTYAVGMHVGAYGRLAETYLDVIGRWFPKSGYELAPEPVVEHYVNDPRITSETELRTEVRVRIAD